MASAIGRTVVIAAAAAASAVAIVAIPIPAAAVPCAWMLPEGLWLDQDNGITVIVPSTNTLRGTAQYMKGQDWNTVTDGTAQGFLNGDGHTFKFTMHWNKGPGAGLSNT